MKNFSFLLIVFGVLCIVGQSSFAEQLPAFHGYALGATSIVLSQFVAASYKSNFAASVLVPAVSYVVTPEGQTIEIKPMTPAQKFLFDYMRTKSNVVTWEAMKANNLGFDPISYYINAIVTGFTGRQEILNETVGKAVGVTNLDRGKLGQFYNFCFDKVLVQYATSAVSAAEPPQALNAWTSVRSAMPAALANGELIIQGDDVNIVNTPISDFTSSAAVTGGGSRGFDGGAIEQPRLLIEQYQIRISLNLALQQAIPSAANTTYGVAVNLIGVQAKLKFN